MDTLRREKANTLWMMNDCVSHIHGSSTIIPGRSAEKGTETIACVWWG